MLRHLSIKNFALIDELDIDFGAGFSVITGETGAGKSIILGALGLLLGHRADAKALKSGAQRCTVEARFDLSHRDMQAFFDENDIDFDPTDTIIRRELTAAGKSRAFVNDTPVALGVLKELGEQLVDVHSQHQNLLLGRHDFQLSVVDTLADVAGEREAYSEVFARYGEATDRLEALKASIEQARQTADYVRFQVDELTEARLVEGEQETLEQRSETMTHSEDIKQGLYEAETVLQADEGGVVQALRRASSALHAIERVYPRAAELTERIDSSYIELKDIASEVSRQLDDIDFDPAELDAVNTRLDRIYELEKKYRAETVGQLIERLARLEEQLSDIDGGDEKLQQMGEEVSRLHDECVRRAQVLTARRREAAAAAEKQMAQRLAGLGMPNVRFRIDIGVQQLGPTGQDRVSFMFSANTSSPLQPVSQVASGGEVARVMLALKAMMSGAVGLPTIIFDEIDTGVSGKMAEQMALIMAQMGAGGRQVVSITHLPQIAALGATHYKVYKEDTAEGTSTHMVKLSAAQRVDEIAQMLSGSSVTQAAVQHAKELLGKRI